jgi:hypothetical protein
MLGYQIDESFDSSTFYALTHLIWFGCFRQYLQRIQGTRLLDLDCDQFDTPATSLRMGRSISWTICNLSLGFLRSKNSFRVSET